MKSRAAHILFRFLAAFAALFVAGSAYSLALFVVLNFVPAFKLQDVSKDWVPTSSEYWEMLLDQDAGDAEILPNAPDSDMFARLIAKDAEEYRRHVDFRGWPERLSDYFSPYFRWLRDFSTFQWSGAEWGDMDLKRLLFWDTPSGNVVFTGIFVTSILVVNALLLGFLLAAGIALEKAVGNEFNRSTVSYAVAYALSLVPIFLFCFLFVKDSWGYRNVIENNLMVGVFILAIFDCTLIDLAKKMAYLLEQEDRKLFYTKMARLKGMEIVNRDKMRRIYFLAFAAVASVFFAYLRLGDKRLTPSILCLFLAFTILMALGVRAMHSIGFRFSVAGHAYRNSIGHFLPDLSGKIPALLGASVLVEMLLGIENGIGKAVITALELQNTPVLLSSAFILAVMVHSASHVFDAIGELLRPRE